MNSPPFSEKYFQRLDLYKICRVSLFALAGSDVYNAESRIRPYRYAGVTVHLLGIGTENCLGLGACTATENQISLDQVDTMEYFVRRLPASAGEDAEEERHKRIFQYPCAHFNVLKNVSENQIKTYAEQTVTNAGST
jgi:hypothetical protein